MYQVQKQKGITLIALVITVIVLIILAGVGINLTLGENGILRRAEDSQKLADEQTVKEKVETAVLDIQIEEVSETGRLTLQRLYETLESKDSNITLNDYSEGDEQLTGTYTLEGKTYSFTINEKFEVVVGEEAEAKPVQFGEMVWNADGTVSLALSSKISDSIEYQINGTEDGNWTSGSTVIGLQQGDKVYVRLNDGTTVTEIQEIEIKDTIAPEEFEIALAEDSITYEAVKVTTTGTTDNQTGLATYSYVAASNGTVVKEITNQTVTEYTIEGLSPETEYVVYMLAYDNAGNVRKSNEVTVTTEAMPVAKTFGQYVDYPIDIDDNPDDYDWQIFYKEDDPDSPNYGATYIIPDYYVPASKMETSLSNAGMSLLKGTYHLQWSSVPTYKEVTEEVKTIFMYDWVGTTNENVKCISRLLDATAWKNDFVTSQLQEKGGMAIGSPTLKMWVASWNKAYPTDEIEYSVGEYGYDFNSSDSLWLNEYTGYKIDAPNIYFPTKSIVGGTFGIKGYYMASPSKVGHDYMLAVDYSGNVRNENRNSSGYGTMNVRPVVYLPKEVTLTPDATTENLWNINY